MSDLKALETLSSKHFNKQSDGTVTVTFATPNTRNYRGLPPAGEKITGEGPEGADTVLSIQDDGTIQYRPKGTDGAFEKATVDSKTGFLIFVGFGDRRFEIPYRD